MIKILLRIAAFILLAVFVVAFPLSLIAHDVGALIFDPDTTKILVRENLLNSQLIAQVAQQAVRQMLVSETGLEGEGGEQPQGGQEEGLDMAAVRDALSNLSEADWQKITDLTAPTLLLDHTVNEVVDAYTAWLNSNQPFPPLKLDLKVWKENTQNNAGQVMTILLDSLPECNQDQLQAFSAADLQSGATLLGGLQACRPPEPYYSGIVANSQLFIQESLKRAPDEIDLDLMTQNQEAPTDLVQFKTSLVRVRLAVTWGWAAIAALGVLAVVIAQRGFGSALRWAGWPLLLSGGPVLVLALGLQFFSLHFLDQFLASALGNQSGALGVLGSAIAGGVLDLVNKPLLMQGGIVTALGLGSLLYARILSRRVASTGIPINKKRVGL